MRAPLRPPREGNTWRATREDASGTGGRAPKEKSEASTSNMALRNWGVGQFFGVWAISIYYICQMPLSNQEAVFFCSNTLQTCVCVAQLELPVCELRVVASHGKYQKASGQCFAGKLSGQVPEERGETVYKSSLSPPSSSPSKKLQTPGVREDRMVTLVQTMLLKKLLLISMVPHLGDEMRQVPLLRSTSGVHSQWYGRQRSRVKMGAISKWGEGDTLEKDP